MASQSLGEPLGEPPHLSVRLKPLMNDGRCNPQGFVGLLGRTEQVGKLRDQLCGKLEVPSGGVELMFEGHNMVDVKTLEENNILLPGPSQRRRGIMPEIFFELKFEEVQRQKKVEDEVLAEIKEAIRRRLLEEREAEMKKKQEESRRIQWELERMAREEQLQLEYAQALKEQSNAILAGLPMDLRRIEYSLDWGIQVTERLRTMAEMALIPLEECMARVSVISARGGLVMEMFSSDAVPMKQDFPFIMVFGPVAVEVRGATHKTVQGFAHEDDRGLPNCWSRGCDDLLVGIESSTAEFKAVTAYFSGTLGWLPDIVALHRVQNSDVYSRFKGKGESDLTIMFHGCRQEINEKSIMEKGFQISACRSGGANYGTWLAYISSYSDSGFVFTDSAGIKHLFICVVSRKEIMLDNQTMRVVGQDCAYPLWRLTYRQPTRR